MTFKLGFIREIIKVLHSLFITKESLFGPVQDNKNSFGFWFSLKLLPSLRESLIQVGPCGLMQESLAFSLDSGISQTAGLGRREREKWRKWKEPHLIDACKLVPLPREGFRDRHWFESWRSCMGSVDTLHHYRDAPLHLLIACFPHHLWVGVLAHFLCYDILSSVDCISGKTYENSSFFFSHFWVIEIMVPLIRRENGVLLFSFIDSCTFYLLVQCFNKIQGYILSTPLISLKPSH